MSLNLGLSRLGLSRGGGGVTLATGRVLNLDMTTGQDYSVPSITSSSAVGLVKGHDGLWVAKPAGYLAGLEGARVNGSAPAWDDGSGNALSGVRWTGPKAATTNLARYSADLSNAVHTLSGATVGSLGASPTGATDAYKLIEDTSTGGHNIIYTNGQAPNVTSGTNYTYTYFYKASGRTKVRNFLASFNSLVVFFDTATGLFSGITGGTVTVTEAEYFSASGFWRISITDTATATGQFRPSNDLVSTGTTVVYTGDGTSGGYYWGFQLEAASKFDGPIPTTSATVTRLAETVAFPQTPGDNWTAVLGVNLSSGVPPFLTRFLGFNLSGKTPLYSDGNNSTSFDGVAPSFPTLALSTGSTKIGVRFANKKVTLKVNSTLGSVSSSDFVVGATTSVLVGQNVSGNYLASPISTVKIWTRALTDVEFANV
jgi:hypothetical protein